MTSASASSPTSAAAVPATGGFVTPVRERTTESPAFTLISVVIVMADPLPEIAEGAEHPDCRSVVASST